MAFGVVYSVHPCLVSTAQTQPLETYFTSNTTLNYTLKTDLTPIKHTLTHFEWTIQPSLWQALEPPTCFLNNVYSHYTVSAHGYSTKHSGRSSHQACFNTALIDQD